ncbi:MAG: hypothetical protein ATN35_00910 [Epulopiscium sp. Nele67-Bin004]|nr:MAG: hypothetical protein ATN35_00910 [Epulopiscium sp. Nele67-Bin004]
MKVLLLSIGTRGDCEPFLAVGNVLRERGDDVVCAFPEQYKHFAKEENFEFFSLGSEFLDLVESDDAKQAMSGTKAITKAKAIANMTKNSTAIRIDLIHKQKEIVDAVNPDCIIFHPKAIYAIPWHIHTKKQVIMLSPVPCVVHEVEGTATVGVNKDFGTILNRSTYYVANNAMVSSIKPVYDFYFKGEDCSDKLLHALKNIKIIYPVSKCILVQEFGDNVCVSGFLERDKTTGWVAPPELEQFLQKHDKIMFITFGSMLNTDPKRNTVIVLEALKKCNIPAIINISGGGLVEPDRYNKETTLFVSSIPYDYILPKMYAVVHHGGAGTTHSAISSACATMAIPHTVDQPMWNEWISKLQLGPKGININKITIDNLAEKFDDLYNNPLYKETARNFAFEMRNEVDNDKLYNFIHKQHNIKYILKELRTVGIVSDFMASFDDVESLKKLSKRSRTSQNMPSIIKKNFIKIKQYIMTETKVIPVYVYRTRETVQDATGLLWLHGGGYAMTSLTSEEHLIEKFVTETNTLVIAPDYTLSVDEPYPTALHECYDTLVWMKEHADILGIKEDGFVVGGVSAGGGLAVALCMYARDKAKVEIKFQMPLYPMINHKNIPDNNTHKQFLWDVYRNEIAWKLYLGDLYNLDDVPAYASPLNASDFSNLPPMYTFIGSEDPFYEDTINYTKKLQVENIVARCDVYDGCYHGFDISKPNAEVSRRAINGVMTAYSYALKNYTNK